jgi:hypothetical protein
MRVHEGVTMVGYTPQRHYTARTLPGVVVEEKGAWGPTGERREEPSGFSFPVYDHKRTYTFHPYDGGRPVPCVAPTGYRTYTKR